jgi:NADH-quinone oxidoreductase subunit L
MFVALGSGAYVFAMFHLLTHAFFKALLFFGAGSVIHGNGGNQDINQMGGLAKKMPYTFGLMFVATLAISGVFPLAGYYSKDAIIEALYVAPAIFGVFPVVYDIAFKAVLAIVFLSSFYSFRLIFVVFFGNYNGTEKHVHESSFSMLFPMFALAIMSIVAGFAGVYIFHVNEVESNFFVKDIPSIAGNGILQAAHHVVLQIKLLPTLFSLSGIILSYLYYIHFKLLNKCDNNLLVKFLTNKWYFDELYDYVLVRPYNFLSYQFALMDRYFINMFVVFGNNTMRTSRYVVRITGGLLNNYALLFMFGLLFYLFVAILFL